jgi:hypothetical protein
MGRRQNRGGTRETPAEQALRDQEVLRANRELAAYFKGRRTEREARAALKIIKAFVRDRERQDPARRPALPGVNLEKTPTKVAGREATSDRGKRHPRKPRRTPRPKSSGGPVVSMEPPQDAQPQDLDTSEPLQPERPQ